MLRVRAVRYVISFPCRDGLSCCVLDLITNYALSC
jgi:hypothetical protein